MSTRSSCGERGVTLSLVSIVTSLLLLALGSAYLTASQSTFQLAAFRERQAKAREAAQAGLAIGLARLGAVTPEAPLHGEEMIDGTRARWELAPAPANRAIVRGVGSAGAGPDEITVTFIAEVERTDAQKLRVLRYARE